MSAPARLRAVADGKSRAKPCKSVELAKRQEVDSWALADAVYDDVNERLPKEGQPSFGRGHSTGLKEAEDAVFGEHDAAGTQIGRTYLHDLYVTRRAWPPEDRLPDVATFDAHYRLRGGEYRNRRQVIERLARKSKTGRVGRNVVDRWKSERKPQITRTFLQLVDQRVRASLKAAASPWHTVAQGDRESIAELLRVIAREVEDGAFPSGRSE